MHTYIQCLFVADSIADEHDNDFITCKIAHMKIKKNSVQKKPLLDQSFPSLATLISSTVFSEISVSSA
jgi:hypothetical protein